MTPAPEPVDQRLQDLIEVIQFTEDLSVKIHGLLDEAEILRTVAEESLLAGTMSVTIFLLDDDRCHLRVTGAPSSPEVQDLRARAQAAGVGPLTQFAVDVDQSTLWRPVIREARTAQHTVADVLRASFPPPAADLILQATGRGALSCVLTPLQRRGNVIGALGVTFAGLGVYLLPPVENLARHITNALEAAQASALRAQAETALCDSETALRAMLDTTSEAIFLVDAQYTILAANEVMAAHFGMSLDQLVGSNAFDILPPQVAAARRAVVARELPSGQPFRFEDRRNNRILETTVYPICDAQGRMEKAAVFSHDITELRQLNEALQESEGHFRQMADVMPAMFWMKSPAVGRVIYLSAAADQIYGYKRQDFYQQPSLWSDVIHPEDRERVVAFCEGHRGEATETEYRIVRRDGEVRWVRDVASAVRNQAGEPEMLAGFVEDITERKHAETQLRQADRLSSLGLMAGGIAHGLRNPLSVISACAQMLLDFPNDASLRTEAAEKINAATKRASQIIESLLQFARPGDVPMTAVDVVAAAEEALVLLAEHLLLHRVTLCKELPPGLPAVRGNGQLLRQVFVELVLNACSAMPQGGTLTVAAATLDARWVEVRFQDTGQGIPSEHLSRIFDPFFTTKPSGTGLGLSVSHAIITQHEGTIGVASTVGQGATFTIRLPRAAVADTEPA